MKLCPFRLRSAYLDDIVKLEDAVIHKTVIYLEGVNTDLKWHIGGVIETVVSFSAFEYERG